MLRSPENRKQTMLFKWTDGMTNIEEKIQNFRRELETQPAMAAADADELIWIRRPAAGIAGTQSPAWGVAVVTPTPAVPKLPRRNG
jgi:hypothetical protein